MNVPLLIDSIVRQTTVLIAQLATAGGLRAPLAHVATQVFVDLARELESHAAHGLPQRWMKVVAYHGQYTVEDGNEHEAADA